MDHSMNIFSIFIILLHIFYCQNLHGFTFPKNFSLFRQPENLMWDGENLALFDTRQDGIEYFTIGGRQPKLIKAPPGSLELTIWNGIASTIRVAHGQIVFSRRYTDGTWQDFPTMLALDRGSEMLTGYPNALFASDTSPRFFSYNQAFGFSLHNEASSCSWWRQGANGLLEPEALIPLELDRPVYVPYHVPQTQNTVLQILHRYEGLLPFLDYPVRVKGAFLIVSWQAGVIWIIKDGSSYPDQIIKLIKLTDGILSGDTPHEAVLMGIQPMKNGHVLLAMRSEASLFPPRKAASAEAEPPSDEPTKAALEDIIWKDLDPLEGTLTEPDSDLLGDAPRHWDPEYSFWFSFDLEGHLLFPRPRREPA